MKKLKAGAYTFYKSLTSVEYYKDVVKAKFSFSLKYLVVLAIVASAITAPIISKPLINEVVEKTNKIAGNAAEYFPEDFVITLKDEKLTTNSETPFIIPIAEEYKSEEIPQNVVVIDPNGVINDIYEYDTLVLINSTNILVQEKTNIKVLPLKGLPEQQIDKEAFIALMEDVVRLFKVVPYIVVALAFFTGLIYYFIFRAMYLAFVALILMGIGAFRKNKLTTFAFGKYYQIAIHAMTMPLLIEVISSVIQFPINIPGWFLTMNLLIGIAALLKMENK